jgi:hypothetical protein
LEIIDISFDTGLVILFGHGNGSLSAPMNDSSSVLKLPSLAVAGDFNNDGRPDVAVVDLYFGEGEVLLNNGDGHFELSTIFNLGSTGYPSSFSAIDLNNDMRLDLVVVIAISGNIVVLFAYGNGTFAAPTRYSTGRNSAPYSAVVRDFNNDGRSDLAVTILNEHKVDVFFGTGHDTFSRPLEVFTGNTTAVSGLVAGDFNSDGKLDIATLDSGSGSIIILMNACVCCTDSLQRATNSL